jgi:outer membrane protein assembly factor BamB
MSTERKFKIPLPAIAVVLILVAGIAGERLLVPKPVHAPAETGTPAAPRTTLTEAEPPPRAPEPTREFVQPEGPIETPVAAVWSTYHGDTRLTGLVDATLPESPEILWRFQTDGSIYHTPVADEHGIYIHTLKGRVYGLGFAGAERWSRLFIREVRGDGTEMTERFDSPIAAFLGMVIVCSLDGAIYALDSATGEDKWKYDLDAPVLGTVNLYAPDGDPANARLLALSQDNGTLYALNPANGELLWETESTDRCDGSITVAGGKVIYGSCAAQFHVFSAGDGSLIRNIDLDSDSQVASGAAFAGDSVFGGSHSGRFFHASVSKGELVWINEDSYDEIFSTPALTEDLVVFSSLDGNVYGLDRATGEKRWNLDTGGYPTSAVIAGERIAIGVDGVLHVLRLDTGESIWSYEISDEIASPAIINGMIVVGSSDGTVTAFGAKPE